MQNVLFYWLSINLSNLTVSVYMVRIRIFVSLFAAISYSPFYFWISVFFLENVSLTLSFLSVLFLCFGSLLNWKIEIRVSLHFPGFKFVSGIFKASSHDWHFGPLKMTLEWIKYFMKDRRRKRIWPKIEVWDETIKKFYRRCDVRLVLNETDLVLVVVKEERLMSLIMVVMLMAFSVLVSWQLTK